MATYTRNVRRCSHFKTNGIQCGAPALRNHNFCHYHRQAYKDFPLRHMPEKPAPIPALNLGLMDDPDGIHHALTHIVYGLVNGTLDRKTASTTVYALQTMSSNFKQTSFQRQLDSEFRKSELNAYQLWEKIDRECEEEKLTRLHEKRVEELKRLEKTCCKCKKQIEEKAEPKVEPKVEGQPGTLANISASAARRTAGDPPAVARTSRPTSRPRQLPPHNHSHSPVTTRHCPLYPPTANAFSNARKKNPTFSSVASGPMSPTRNTLPASGPKPPMISMPCSSSSTRRTFASSTVVIWEFAMTEPVFRAHKRASLRERRVCPRGRRFRRGRLPPRPRSRVARLVRPAPSWEGRRELDLGMC